MKAFNKKNDTNLAKRAADATLITVAAGLDAAAGGIPVFSGTWTYCKAVMGNAINMRHQRVLEWLDMVQQHPELFRKELLDSDEFQDAFVVALEDYIKTRTTLKRGIAQRIFLDYTAAADKDRFTLEQYNMTLRQISVDSLQFMGYLRDVVERRQYERVQQSMDKVDFNNSPVTEDQAREAFMKQQPLSYAYKDIHPGNGQQYMLPDKPNPLYPNMQASTGVTIPDENRRTHSRCLHELTSLGILTRDRYTTPMSDIDPKTIFHDIWNYTDYGRAFADFVENGQTIQQPNHQTIQTTQQAVRP